MKVTSCLYCDAKKLAYVTHRSDANGIIRCERCGVMMVEHISDDTEGLYTADYFEKEQGTKNGYTNYLSSPVANLIGKYAFAQLFSKQKGNHLDLGCADGSLIEIFTAEGFSSKGLEISKDAVAIANSKGLDVQFSRLHSFPKELPGSDVITAYDLLEHADKPGVVLKEIYKNLNDGGHFVFSTLSVKSNDPSDYWFNNSLEHYVYYNTESLEFILSEVFGKDNFAFVEMDINGIAEFWGVATKGKPKNERAIIDIIKRSSFDKKNADQGYLLSIFYNQVAEFKASQNIARYFEKTWSVEQQTLARFYNNYYQGKLEVAIEESKNASHLMPVSSSVYWQALSSAEETFAQIKLDEARNEILNLRSQLFSIRDEIHTLRNSRVVGRIIKARDKVGNPATLPRRVTHKIRRTVAKFVPDKIRLPFMRSLRGAKSNLSVKAREYKDRAVVIKTVHNTPWPKDQPLVSVIIPYFNRADTIDDTLKSLVAQTFLNFETIIVDDYSSDPVSIEKLKTFKNIRIIRHKINKGVATARNTGIKQAKGKYIICLDSDDMLDPTFIEKATLALELNPDVALITTHQDMFGVVNEIFEKHPYDPLRLMQDNMVITAAEFRKEAWVVSGGYKPKLGYEDWDFWLTLSEHGFWGKLIPEPLFKYRTAMQSRYIEDKDVHWNNVKTIRNLHPKYKKMVRGLMASRQSERHVVSTNTGLINLSDRKHYLTVNSDKPNILVTVPWMDFGGVSTLLNNFTQEVKLDVNLHFITGLQSKNEWEYKFKAITPRVYHMSNLFDEDVALQLEFVSNYIATRDIDTLHIVHNGFIYPMLDELKKRFPKLRVISTVFNNRAPYLLQSTKEQEHIDIFTTDNLAVQNIYKKLLDKDKDVRVIPNGIDSEAIFNPKLFEIGKIRQSLGLTSKDTAVFYIGRLSEEKNPDLFVEMADKLIKKGLEHTKFFVIGDGPMHSKIDHAIHHTKSTQIRYLGYQPNVAEYLAAADIFVLPSSIEGFPLSIIEAMAMNVAIVATNVGAVSEVIETGKNGIVVDEVDAGLLAENLEELIAKPDLLNKIKASNRSVVDKKYSNTILGRNYRKLYRP